MDAPWYGILWVLLVILMGIGIYNILKHYFGDD
jgi:hypothetical protein